MFLALMGLGLAVQPAPAAPLAMPTETLAAAGPPGDFVSKSYGGVFHKAIGVIGSSNEQQFSVRAHATQTANIVEVQNASATPIWGITYDYKVTGIVNTNGAAGTCTAGTTIAHGIGTTPTTGILTAYSSTTVTRTFAISSMDATYIYVTASTPGASASCYWAAWK
jgi:hypothetical protein